MGSNVNLDIEEEEEVPPVPIAVAFRHDPIGDLYDPVGIECDMPIYPESDGVIITNPQLYKSIPYSYYLSQALGISGNVKSKWGDNLTWQ